MSCQKNGNIGARAGTSAGIPKMNSQVSNVTGAMISRVQQAGDSALAARIDAAIDYGGRLMAPGAALATGTFTVAGASETKKVAGGVGGAAVGYMLLKDKPAGVKQQVGGAVKGGLRTAAKAIPAVGTALKVIKKVERVTTLAGDVAGFASRQGEVGQVMQDKRTLFFFKSQVPVTLWQSSLTGLINRQDVIGTSRFGGKNIASSEGVMFRTGGKTWHRATDDYPPARTEPARCPLLFRPADLGGACGGGGRREGQTGGCAGLRGPGKFNGEALHRLDPDQARAVADPAALAAGGLT
jgi:hypothetical protein